MDSKAVMIRNRLKDGQRRAWRIRQDSRELHELKRALGMVFQLIALRMDRDDAGTTSRIN